MHWQDRPLGWSIMTTPAFYDIFTAIKCLQKALSTFTQLSLPFYIIPILLHILSHPPALKQKQWHNACIPYQKNTIERTTSEVSTTKTHDARSKAFLLEPSIEKSTDVLELSLSLNPDILVSPDIYDWDLPTPIKYHAFKNRGHFLLHTRLAIRTPNATELEKKWGMW